MRNLEISWAIMLPVAAVLLLSSASDRPLSAQQLAPRYAFDTGSEAYANATQQNGMQQVATSINNHRAELFRRGDIDGMAAMYTPDATYIELLPRLDLMQGRAEIAAHLRAVRAANATDLQSTVTSVRAMGPDTLLVGGDYTLAAKDRRIMGHFTQILRGDGAGTWRISSHVFARPEPVTFREEAENRGG